MSNTQIGKPNVLANALVRTINQQKREKKNRAGVAVLAAPVPPDWWNGDTSFAGLVPREDQEKDMRMLIAEWPNSARQGETDYLLFQWKSSASSDWQDAQPAIPIQGPLDPNLFPMPLTLSKANFEKEGTFDLRYRVTIDAGTTTDSDITQFIIDKTPPNGNQSPTAPTFVDNTVISDGVTGDYLASRRGVDIEITGYQDQQWGDTLQIYVHSPGTSPTDPNHVGKLDANRQITIPDTAFEGLLDGLIYVAYRLLDKVGNRGPESNNAITGLFIQPLPVPPLAAPRVPRIVDDKVLNLNDVALGENLVEIDLYEHWLEHDQVVLTWGTASTKVFHGITSDQSPMTLTVSYDLILKEAYGAGPGVVSTPVSYVVKRGNKEFASEVATIDVDFFVPGPVNPDRPDPINVNLPRVTVKGTGSTSTDNVLNADDVDKPVEVTVDLYDPIGTGEQMILYWNSTDSQVEILSPVTGSPGDPYTFTVAWDDIKDLPSSTAVPVFYTVGRVGGTGNIESCVPTLVDVSAALPIELAPPEFPDAGTAADGSPILNCSSFMGADQHVNVHIPGNNPLLKGGESLEFTWSCFTDRLGQVPAGTPQVFARTITSAEATDGFEVVAQPFADYILPVDRNGSITLTYVSDTVPPMQGTILIRAAAMDAAGVCEPNARRGFKATGCNC